MGLENYDRPSPDTGLSAYSLENLREELNSLDRGLSELMERRRAVTTEINIRIDDTRMHLGHSEEHFAKAMGMIGRDEEVPTEKLKDPGMNTRGW